MSANLRRVRVLSPSTKALSVGQLRALRFGFLLSIAAYAVGVFQFVGLESPHKIWIFLVACAAGVLFFGWLNAGLRRLYEPMLRNRQQLLAEKLVRGETLRVRGTPGVFVPMMLSLMVLVYGLPTDTASTLSGRALLAACIGLLAVFWYWAVPRLRAPILELDRRGLRTRQLGHVPWSDIELAQLRVNGSVDHGFIASHVLQLEFVIDRHPRPARGVRRWAEYFFRGMREWEARIALRNPSENALVILNLVMFCIRNTPRYQEQRRVRREGPPESLENFEPHDLPGLPLSPAASMAKAKRVAARLGSTMELSRPRIQRVRLLPRRRNSKILRWVGPVAGIVLTVLVLMGIRANFLVSPAWLRASLIVALVVAAWPVWLVARAVFYTPETGQLSSPMSRVLAGWVLIPVGIYFGAWLIVARCIPDLFARFMGTPFSEVHVLSKHYDYSRRRCDYQVRGGPFEEEIGKDYYCAWISEYERLPDRGPMTIRGRAFWFGRHVDSIEPVDPLSTR